MEYFALIFVGIALFVGCLCGVLQNIIAHKKKKDVYIKETNKGSQPFIETMIPSEQLLIAGNVSLIENRCDEDLSALMSEVFDIYERDSK